jgi:hypothetical protein
MKRVGIVRNSLILLSLVAIANFDCTRAGSSKRHAHSLKPAPATTPYHPQSTDTESSSSQFLPNESW